MPAYFLALVLHLIFPGSSSTLDYGLFPISISETFGTRCYGGLRTD